MIRPVRVDGFQRVIQGLPLVPLVNPAQSNLSCRALCRVVQFWPLTGIPERPG